MRVRRCGIVAAAVIAAVALGGCALLRPTRIQRTVTVEEAAAALDAGMTKLGCPYVWGREVPMNSTRRELSFGRIARSFLS